MNTISTLIPRQNCPNNPVHFTNHDRKQAESSFEKTIEYNKLSEKAKILIRELSEENCNTFVVDSWFLQDLIRYLTPRQDEEICYITGVEISGTKVLSRICGVTYKKQSPVRAIADARSCSDVLININQRGMALFVMAHSHPGRGIGGTLPSSIDMEYMKAIQDAGSKAIGLICCRDGHIRAFTDSVPFKIILKGNGIKRIDDDVFKVSLSA